MKVSKISEVQYTKKYQGNSDEQAKEFRDIIKRKAKQKESPKKAPKSFLQDLQDSKNYPEDNNQDLENERAIFELRRKINQERE